MKRMIKEKKYIAIFALFLLLIIVSVIKCEPKKEYNFVPIISKYYEDFYFEMKEKNILERLKSFNTDLHKNFDFMELGFQPLEYTHFYSGKDIFVYGNDVNLYKNQKIKIQNKGEIYLTPLKALQMDQSALEILKISEQLYQGNIFIEKNYIYKKMRQSHAY